MMNDSLCRIIAGELQARAEQVEAAVRLLDEGNTVPFIARYRKEVTGGLDDTQLRNLETRLGYLRELEDRRQAILKSIAEQGKLTDALEKAINTTLSKTELEDLYLPYKPKTPRCWRRSVTICGKTPTWSPPSSAVKKRKALNSATTSITMNRSPPCRRIARWRCSAVATKASCSSL